MYDIIKIVIDAGGYSLPDVLGKIEREWVLGHLTDEERDQLIDAARANATPEGSMPPVAERVTAVETALRDLTQRVETLEGAEPTAGDEWPEYVEGQSYYAGDRITYKGDRYVCVYPDKLPCVWPPSEYPSGWKKQ